MMSLFTGHALSLSARPTFARPPNKHSLRVLLDLRPRAFGGGNNAEAFSHANAAVAELRAKKDTDDLPVAIERAAEGDLLSIFILARPQARRCCAMLRSCFPSSAASRRRNP